MHSPCSILGLGGQIHLCVFPKITQVYKFKWAIPWDPLEQEKWNLLQTCSVSLLCSHSKFEKDPRTWVDMSSN